MKSIVGVDLGGSYRSSLDLLKRFGFPRLSVDLVNVIEPFAETGYFAPSGYVPPSWDVELKAAGELAVEQAVGKLCAKNIPANGHVMFGGAAECLTAAAERESADVIVLGSSNKSRWTSVLLGSVGRALTIGCDKSLLIARRVEYQSGPLTIVFGTDHSDYANKCVDKFLAWRPGGVNTVHLVTAYHVEPWAKDVIDACIPEGEDANDWLKREFLSRSEDVGRKFREAGYEVHVHVLQGHPNEVLHHAMSAFGCDVLVLGGQGHGFVERMVVGSVALHQAVAEPYSIFIVRP